MRRWLVIAALTLAACAGLSQSRRALLMISHPTGAAEATVNSPTDIPNIHRWYDADYQATYIDGDFMETATPWTNRVYGTHNLTGTGSARPTFRTFIQNGKPGWLYDGSDDVSTMTTVGAQSSLTVVGIFRITQAHASSTMGLLDDSAGNSEIWISASTGPTATKLRVDDASDTLAESSALDSAEWTNAMMAVWAIDGTDCKFYWNGTNYGTDSAMGSIGSFTLDRMGAAAGLQFKGYMHEWIIYTNYKASATQIGQLWSNYASNKWFAADPFEPTDESGLVIWHKADSSSAADGDQVAQWDDSSGNNYHATQGTQINRPHYLANQINGLPAMRFYGTNHYFNISNVLNGLGLSSAEVFVVVKVVSETETAKSGFWSMTSTTEDTHFPYNDGVIYDSFGTDGRHTTGNPSLALTSWRLYNVQTAANAWTNRLDGAVHYGSGVNAVGFSQTSRLHLGSSWSTGTYTMDGWIAEFIIYDHVLTAARRDSLEAYIAAKYGLTIP